MKKTPIIIVSILGFILFGLIFLEASDESYKDRLRSDAEVIRPQIDAFMAGEEVNPDIFSWYNRTHRKVDVATLEHYLNEGLITEEEHQAFLGAHLEVRWSRKDAVATAK